MKAAADLDLGIEAVGQRSSRAFQVVSAARRTDLGAAEQAVCDLLRALGFDTADDGLEETPRRVATALLELVTPVPFRMTTFANAPEAS